MPRTPEANELVKDKRRKQILTTALKLFCLEGYDNVTMDEIAKKSKISHGLIYHYYTKKSDILDILIKLSREKFNSIFDFSSVKTLEGEEFFQNLTDFILSCLSIGGDYVYYICLHLSIKSNPKNLNEFDITPIYKLLEKNFLIAQEKGDFEQGNIKEYLICYFYLLNSITMAAIYSNGKAQLPSSNVIMNLLKKSKD